MISRNATQSIFITVVIFYKSRVIEMGRFRQACRSLGHFLYITSNSVYNRVLKWYTETRKLH
jgi:hypothetical protein